MIFEELHYIIGRPGELITAAGNYITSAALSGIFMPCVCVMHCRRRFFSEKVMFLGFWSMYPMCFIDFCLFCLYLNVFSRF